MDKIGKALRKGGGDQSAHTTTQYEKLTQDPSDDDPDDDVVFLQDGRAYHSNGNASKKSNGSLTNGMEGSALIEEAMKSGLLQKATRSAGDKIQVRQGRCMLLNHRRVICILFVLLAILAGCLISLFVSPYLRRTNKPSKAWDKEFIGFGSETCVRLVDVNSDGVLDVIVAMSVSLNGSQYNNLSLADIRNLCTHRGETYPCLGRVMALRGNDSSILWTTNIHAGLIELSCGKVDINKDGQMDCIGTGRFGTTIALSPTNGEILWTIESEHLMDAWSSFNTLVLPDFNNDQIPELLLMHSSDPRFPPEVTQRIAGRLILLNGANGKSMGRYLAVPDDKETYMAPVLHTLADKSQYILFGSGGETIPGSLLSISVPDFYRYVMKMDPGSVVPNTQGAYADWKANINATSNLKIVEIHRGVSRGVMVPPVLIDMNGDKIKDILVLDFDGNLTLYNGQTLVKIWTTSFHDMQSYSSPAPGYFNDDDTIDFMLQFGCGKWPEYNCSIFSAKQVIVKAYKVETIVPSENLVSDMASRLHTFQCQHMSKYKQCSTYIQWMVIVNGKTGESLWTWKMNGSRFTYASGLTLRTSEDFRDLFLFRVFNQHQHSNQSLHHVAKRQSNRRKSQNTKPRDRKVPRQGAGGYRGPGYEARGAGAYERPQPYQGLAQSPGSLGLGANDYDYYGLDGPPLYEYDGYKGSGGGRPGPRYGNGYPPQNNPDNGDQSAAASGKKNVPVLSFSVAPPTAPPSIDSLIKVPATDKASMESMTVGQFVMDRTIAHRPLLLSSDEPSILKYNLTEEEIQSIKRSIIEVEEPTRRRKRRHEDESDSSVHMMSWSPEDVEKYLRKEMFTILVPEEIATGAIGDVDGDGSLDLISIVILSGSITNPWGGYVRVAKSTKIRKINLELRLRNAKLHDYISASVQTALRDDPSLEAKISEVKLKPLSQQFWAGYLGTSGDSVYGELNKG